MLQIGLMLLCATTICGLGADEGGEVQNTTQQSAPVQQSASVQQGAPVQQSMQNAVQDLLKGLEKEIFERFIENIPRRKAPLDTPLFGACINPQEVTDQTYCPMSCGCCGLCVEYMVPNTEELAELLKAFKGQGIELVQASPACIGMTCSTGDGRCQGVAQYSMRNEECCGLAECSSCCMGKILAGCFSPCCGQSESKFYFQYRLSNGEAIDIELGKLADWQGQGEQQFVGNVLLLRSVAEKAKGIRQLWPFE